MADIAIYLCVENLKQLMSSGLTSVEFQKDRLQSLHENINQMSMLLKSTEEKGPVGQKDKNDVDMEIKDMVFEAENVVDLFRFDSVAAGDLSAKLDTVKEEMEAIIKKYKDGISELELGDSTAGITTHLVGIQPKIDKIIERFGRGTHLDVISIVGLPGIGKTALAKEICNDDYTEDNFEICIWMELSEEENMKIKLLSSSLEDITENWETDAAACKESLGCLLLEQLQDHSYLAIMDGVRSTEILFDLLKYLPDNCNGSKIIVTTREETVSKAIEELNYYIPHETRVDPLSEEDSWGILQRKLLENQTTLALSKELEDFGKMIVKQCHGLPLAIDAVSEVLTRKAKTPSLWGSTANTLATFLKAYTEEHLMNRYAQLPPHLKACLLYIGSFPELYHIPVRNLALLLVAEGIITEETGDGLNGIAPINVPEVIAEGYISDLVNRGLVMVSRKRICGATKTCRILSLMREFCSVRGEEGKFADQVLHTDKTAALIVNQSDPRRLFISREAYTKTSLEPCAESLRSILCFRIGNDGYRMHRSRAFRENEFKLLKVLDLLSIQIHFPSEMGVMVHLTYLAVRCKALPESITNLFNLETLVLSNHFISFPPGASKMSKLRHVCNKDGVVCFGSSSPIVENLQTLYQLCGCDYCKKIVSKMHRIRILGLSQYDLSYSAPDSLTLLENLESLKCNFRNQPSFVFNYDYTNDYQYHINNYDYFLQAGRTLPKLKLPSSIKRLTLKSTCLKWESLSILGTLPNLEVLKLLDDAVKEGRLSCWDTSEQDFPRLKCLKMRKLDITKWVDDNLQFKSLEVLVIEYCEQFQMLPAGLARVPSLHFLHVESSNITLKNLCLDYCVRLGKSFEEFLQ